jgi:hypothetical protein
MDDWMPRRGTRERGRVRARDRKGTIVGRWGLSRMAISATWRRVRRQGGGRARVWGPRPRSPPAARALPRRRAGRSPRQTAVHALAVRQNCAADSEAEQSAGTIRACKRVFFFGLYVMMCRPANCHLFMYYLSRRVSRSSGRLWTLQVPEHSRRRWSSANCVRSAWRRRLP